MTFILFFVNFHFMLPISRLYSFIDQTEGFTIHFLEGQQLIQEIAITHKLNGEGFHFFRDVILSTQQLLAYLKPDEGLGIYIDSELPYFRFKIEMNYLGEMRTLLLPEELNEFPQKISGQCRLVKTTPTEKNPYTSIIKLHDTPLNEIMNQLLRNSYQLKSQIFLSDESDQSLMISKLPAIDVNRVQTNYTLSVDEYWLKYKKDFLSFLAEHLTDYAKIQDFFESKNILLLSTKEVRFKCSCSKERMESGLWSLVKSSGIDHIFAQDEDTIETKCDYCQKTYNFNRIDFLS